MSVEASFKIFTVQGEDLLLSKEAKKVPARCIEFLKDMCEECDESERQVTVTFK